MSVEDDGAMDWIQLRETLARLEHARWAHWQRYLHGQCEPGGDGALLIPKELVERWQRQIDTPYDQLSESEKDSDREQVDKVVRAMRDFLEARD